MHFDHLPAECLADETLGICIRNATAGALVTVRLCSVGHGGQVLVSEAVFAADDEGIVDLAVTAPASGSYRGVDPMGLFWSRAPASAADAVACGALGQDSLVATVRAESCGDVALHRVRRVFAGPDVYAREIGEDGLVGTMFLPPEPGPHSAVLVVGGSDGGLSWSREMASLLASHGHAALALAYFAAEGLPATLDRIPLEYFAKALEWMARQSEVSPDRIAVCGLSRGGELALLLGAHFPAIKAVVAYVPSGIAWPAYPATGHGAWTLGGQELPYANVMTYEAWDRAVAEGRARTDSFDWYLLPLQDAAFAKAVSIRVERIQGPVLLISGEADGVWPSSALANFAVRRLKDHAFPHRVVHLRYAEAGHGIAWPHAPTTMTKFKHRTSGEDVDLGGTAEGTAHARADSWGRVLSFLASALAERAGDEPSVKG